MELELVKVAPPRGMARRGLVAVLRGGAQDARIIGAPRRDRAHQEQDRREAGVLLVQPLAELPLERRAVQEGQVQVIAEEVYGHEGHHQIGRGELERDVVVRRADTFALPLHGA